MQASIDEAQKHEYGIGRSMQAWGLDILKLINLVEFRKSTEKNFFRNF